jgi:hypothetical protein
MLTAYSLNFYVFISAELPPGSTNMEEKTRKIKGERRALGHMA